MMAFRNAEFPLLENANSTGGSIDWPGGSGVFTLMRGTINGATVALHWSPDNGTTFLPVDSGSDTYVTLTAAGGGHFELPACKLRANVSGGAPSGLYATVFGLDQ